MEYSSQYEFNVRKTLSFNSSLTKDDVFILKLEYKQNAADAILFTLTHMKIRYNAKHKFLLFRFENKTFLKLHKKYNIKNQHKKSENQRCECFLIKRRVNRFAYELNILFK